MARGRGRLYMSIFQRCLESAQVTPCLHVKTNHNIDTESYTSLRMNEVHYILLEHTLALGKGEQIF
jgi:hypothetical protein